MCDSPLDRVTSLQGRRRVAAAAAAGEATAVDWSRSCSEANTNVNGKINRIVASTRFGRRGREARQEQWWS